MIMKELLQRENYEWMIKATPQREWIESRGILLWLAFFFSEIGAGVYFISLISNFNNGLIAGWLITLVLGGLIHTLYLGNPLRAWRIFLKPGTSELSRGVWGMMLFGIIGFIQIVASLSGSGSIALSLPVKVVAAILCIVIVMHGFTTMNVMKALPSWSSSILLPLSLVSGIWVGSQIALSMIFMSGKSGVNIAAFETWSLLLVLVYVGFILFFLMSSFHSSDTARISVSNLIKGTGVKSFYLVLIAGMIIPILISLFMMGSEVQGSLVFIRLVSVIIGDLALRYGIMRSAFYTPLI